MDFCEAELTLLLLFWKRRIPPVQLTLIRAAACLAWAWILAPVVLIVSHLLNSGTSSVGHYSDVSVKEGKCCVWIPDFGFWECRFDKFSNPFRVFAQRLQILAVSGESP
jgi:hypothetical protein